MTTLTSDLTTIEPLSCSTASLIIEDWLGDKIATDEEHWEAGALTRRRARPQLPGCPQFTNQGYLLTVATTAIMRMTTGNGQEAFVWMIDDDQVEIARGYAQDMLSAMRDCELKMQEIAARDRA
ncbi:UNVERIFIED_ORG: hypothetical protein J2W85_000776 [Ensifer adhaerens]|nr:hypothetical protein [Ensifer adhaerens]